MQLTPGRRIHTRIRLLFARLARIYFPSICDFGKTPVVLARIALAKLVLLFSSSLYLYLAYGATHWVEKTWLFHQKTPIKNEILFVPLLNTTWSTTFIKYPTALVSCGSNWIFFLDWLIPVHTSWQMHWVLDDEFARTALIWCAGIDRALLLLSNRRWQHN